MPLQIIRQDITKMKCDAIVNPSNEELVPGGSTDAAIHEAAGERLLEACQKIGGVKVGKAVITPAFDLPCKYVIHTAGPCWNGGKCGEQQALASCYQASLVMAKEYNCESIAFPLISSGTYGYPKDKVLKTAIEAISDFLFENEMMVYLLVFDKKSYELSEKLFSDINSYIDDVYVFEHLDNYEEIEYMILVYRTNDECIPGVRQEKNVEFTIEEGFAIKLLKLIDSKGMTDVECYKKANVSKQTWYKIMNEKNYRPNKKTVISFAVALRLSLEETQQLLASVGFTLSKSDLFDVVIMYCISSGIYDVAEIDSVLFKYDLETLYSKV